MRKINYTVPPEYDGRKVLHFLRGGAGCSYTLVRSLKVFEDGILLNGVRTRTIDHVHAGDTVTITLHDHPKDAQQCDTLVEVLYEDEDIIVYNKPPAMACHQAKQHQQGTLANVFAQHCAQQGTALTCRILNRMDRDTSGAVLIAKNAFAAAALTGQVHKLYLAIVSGAPDPADGMIDAPIGQPDRCDPRRAVMEGGQRALTEYRTVASCTNYSAVYCTLPTGRTHQIRVHMSHAGCPLLGDALYGGEQDLIQRQALHCMEVSFSHPVSGEKMTITATVPQDMQKLLEQCPKS
ncbi:RluA family pseudouridine synthase [Oscillospiraceae bacterium PP1C4]